MQPNGGENLGLQSSTQEDYFFSYKKYIKTYMMAKV